LNVIASKNQLNEKYKRRTKKFALDIMEFSEKIPGNTKGKIIKNQILRSSFSVASNYRTVCIAKSAPDFINKLNIVLEEADETQFWIELLAESGLVNREETEKIHKEASEIVAIITASLKTTKERYHRKTSK